MKKFRTPITLVAAVALMTLTPGAASADQDAVGGALGQVQDETASVAKRFAPGAAAQAAPSDSDLPGNETEDPNGADHGSAKAVGGSVAGQDLAEVGGNDATVEDDDSTKADSTLLALGGQEILGTHADSAGENESHFGDPLNPVCEGSGGAACLTVLYADAFASDDGTTSESGSRSGIANACLGGSDTDASAPCTGPVHAGAATSEGQADRDQSSGRTTASSFSDVAELCLQPDPITGECSIGANVLHSQGQADSGGSQATSSRGSSLLGVNAAGQELGPIEDPTDLSIQPECADPSPECTFLNQGEAYAAGSNAGHAQDALKATVLPGELDASAGVSHSETLVNNDGRETTADAEGTPDEDAAGNPEGGTDGGADGDPGTNDGMSTAGAGLPNTGGVWSGLLALGLLSIAVGGFLTAYGRRGRTLPV